MSSYMPTSSFSQRAFADFSPLSKLHDPTAYPAERKKIRQTFALFDKDGKGYVPRE
jgi:Ca2+-binding EF-hand superfamily protein